MADYGIENMRKATITFTLPSGDLVLVPGKNRLSKEKYEELKKNKFFADHANPDEKEYPETSTDDDGNIVTKMVKVRVSSSLIDYGEIQEPKVEAKADAETKKGK